MKSIKYLVLLFLISLFYSCSDSCDCNQDWDPDITYVSNDKVAYDGKCWIAVAQGRGITPGPWLQNGNDIWEECTE